MTREDLIRQIRTKESYLCVGLDPDEGKLPLSLGKGAAAVLAFCQEIIDATRLYCVAYKLNTAFFEAMGAAGWAVLRETIAHIGDNHFIIADAKRGDIGNTGTLYARALFDDLGADCATVAPYMGADSVAPFLSRTDKMTALLGLTSNAGNADFQLLTLANGRRLYEQVILQAQRWAKPDRLMFVVGATQADKFAGIRCLAPEYFLLVPGVGAQGGNLEELSCAGLTPDVGLLVNSSRQILYAESGPQFARAAARQAQTLAEEMKRYLNAYSR